MVVLTCIFRIGKEVGELIEGGNLHSAGARELFFHVGDGGVWQYTTIGTYYRLTIFVGCFDGIEIDNRQSPHFCNGCAVLRDILVEDILQIGSRVSADEQNLLAFVGHGNGCGAGQARLANATLTGEEQIFLLLHLLYSIFLHSFIYLLQQQQLSLLSSCSPPQQQPPSLDSSSQQTLCLTGTNPRSLPVHSLICAVVG